VWNVVKAVVKAVQEWADANPELAAVVKTVLAVAAAVYVLSTALGVLEFALGIVVLFLTPLWTLLTAAVPVIAAVVSALGTVLPVLLVLGTVLALVALNMSLWEKGFFDLNDFLQQFEDILKDVGKSLGEFLSGVAGFSADVLLGVLEQIGRSLNRLFSMFGALKDVFADVGRGVLAAFGTGDLDLAFKLLEGMFKLTLKTVVEWMKMEFFLAFDEIFISVEMGLKKAFENASSWLVILFDRVVRRIPGANIGGVTPEQFEASVNRNRDRAVAVLEAERLNRMAEASRNAATELDKVIRNLRNLPEVAQMLQQAEHARFLSAAGESVRNIYKTYNQALRDIANQDAGVAQKQFQIGQLMRAPDSALAGVVGPGAVQAEYERLLRAAVSQANYLDLQFREFERGNVTRKQFDETRKAAEDAAKQFFDFRDTLTGVAGAARKAAADIGKIFEVGAEARAYWMDVTKEFDKGVTALGKFARGTRMIEEAVMGPFKTFDRRAAAMGLLGAGAVLGNDALRGLTDEGSPQETFALFREYDALHRAVGKADDRRPPVALQGSREAAEIIGRNQTAVLSVQEQMAADIKMGIEINRQQRDYMQQVADEMRRRRAAGEVIPVPLPGNQ
jgi:hypothetical protein